MITEAVALLIPSSDFDVLGKNHDKNVLLWKKKIEQKWFHSEVHANGVKNNYTINFSRVVALNQDTLNLSTLKLNTLNLNIPNTLNSLSTLNPDTLNISSTQTP